ALPQRFLRFLDFSDLLVRCLGHCAPPGSSTAACDGRSAQCRNDDENVGQWCWSRTFDALGALSGACRPSASSTFVRACSKTPKKSASETFWKRLRKRRVSHRTLGLRSGWSIDAWAS